MICFDIVLGTRPEIIKFAPIIRRFKDQGVSFRIIHTGQHYDPLLDGVFFQDLDIPQPSIHLHAAATSQGAFLGSVFCALEEIWKKDKPSAVLVQGDTNSAFAGAFIAQRLGISVVHIEAGLRSGDKSMPEEINRIFIDHIADRLYVPTRYHYDQAKQDGIQASHILVTGNTIADALREHLPSAKKMIVPFKIPLKYVVITLHRPALVDDPVRLNTMLNVIASALAQHQLLGIFPVHPRTHQHLGSFVNSAISLLEPIGYFLMLRLLQGAELIVTDSGGLQEEAALLQVPCVTVRENTERPETIDAGGNILAGLDPQRVRDAIHVMLNQSITWKPLYDVQNPSDYIIKDLLSYYL